MKRGKRGLWKRGNAAERAWEEGRAEKGEGTVKIFRFRSSLRDSYPFRNLRPRKKEGRGRKGRRIRIRTSPILIVELKRSNASSPPTCRSYTVRGISNVCHCTREEVARYRNGAREEEKEGGRRGSRVRSTLARAVSVGLMAVTSRSWPDEILRLGPER